MLFQWLEFQNIDRNWSGDFVEIDVYVSLDSELKIWIYLDSDFDEIDPI